VTLGVFNFAETFVFMLLPPLLMDRKGRDLPTAKLWSVAMFLTNALLLPYMANRTMTPVPASWEADRAAAVESGEGLAEVARGEKGLLSKSFGFFGLAVGVLSVWWAAAADPAVGGDLAQRSAFLGDLMQSDRVSLAFAVDIVAGGVLRISTVPTLRSSSSSFGESLRASTRLTLHLLLLLLLLLLFASARASILKVQDITLSHAPISVRVLVLSDPPARCSRAGRRTSSGSWTPRRPPRVSSCPSGGSPRGSCSDAFYMRSLVRKTLPRV